MPWTRSKSGWKAELFANFCQWDMSPCRVYRTRITVRQALRLRVPEAAERFISGLDDSLRRVQQKSPPRGSKEGFRLDNLQREPCAAH
jgi:hypothetical protein